MGQTMTKTTWVLVDKKSGQFATINKRYTKNIHKAFLCKNRATAREVKLSTEKGVTVQISVLLS